MMDLVEPAVRRARLVRGALAVLAIAASAALVVGAARADHAQSHSLIATNADVDILEPIVISEDANLNFGLIIAPSSGNTDYTVTTGGDISVSLGDGVAVSGHQAGQYDIEGTDSEALTLTVSADGCSNANLQLLSVDTNPVLPTTLDILNLKLGGKLRVASTAPDGPHTCNYAVEASY